MGNYELTVDGFTTNGATDAELEGLVIVHNVMNALLSPHSQDAKEMIRYIDQNVVDSRFFNQDGATAFREGVAEFYRIDEEETKDLPEETTLADIFANEEIQATNKKLGDLFMAAIRPYVDATKPVILDALPDRYKRSFLST